METIAKHVGVMAVACIIAALGGAAFAFVSTILIGGVDIDAGFFVTLALRSYAYFVFLFAFPVLPIFWAAKQIGVFAQLVCLALVPFYVAYFTMPTPRVLTADSVLNALSNQIVVATTIAMVLYLCGDAYLDRRATRRA